MKTSGMTRHTALRSPMFLAKVWGQTGSKLYGAKSGADYVDNQRRFRIFNEVRNTVSHCLTLALSPRLCRKGASNPVNSAPQKARSV